MPRTHKGVSSKTAMTIQVNLNRVSHQNLNSNVRHKRERIKKTLGSASKKKNPVEDMRGGGIVIRI